MRVDLALKYLCLVKSRSSVKSLCASNGVRINDKPAKPSASLHVGDRVAIDYSSRTVTIELVDIPGKQLSKTDAPSFYRVV